MHASAHEVQGAHEDAEEEGSGEVVVARILRGDALQGIEHRHRSPNDLRGIDAELLQKGGLVLHGGSCVAEAHSAAPAAEAPRPRRRPNRRRLHPRSRTRPRRSTRRSTRRRRRTRSSWGN